ncbi:hypothetical protein L1887_46807 [Cichorium endivia]|nr:hypothetical protein L1887_46807 [Cichorium endivia]
MLGEGMRRETARTTGSMHGHPLCLSRVCVRETGRVEEVAPGREQRVTEFLKKIMASPKSSWGGKSYSTLGRRSEPGDDDVPGRLGWDLDSCVKGSGTKGFASQPLLRSVRPPEPSCIRATPETSRFQPRCRCRCRSTPVSRFE